MTACHMVKYRSQTGVQHPLRAVPTSDVSLPAVLVLRHASREEPILHSRFHLLPAHLIGAGTDEAGASKFSRPFLPRTGWAHICQNLGSTVSLPVRRNLGADD